MYKDLLGSETGVWTLSEINDADYYLLMELFNDKPKPKKEKRMSAMDFFGTFMSPADMARAKGEAPVE